VISLVAMLCHHHRRNARALSPTWRQPWCVRTTRFRRTHACTSSRAAAVHHDLPRRQWRRPTSPHAGQDGGIEPV